jgi:hypothetical protein
MNFISDKVDQLKKLPVITKKIGYKMKQRKKTNAGAKNKYPDPEIFLSIILSLQNHKK